MKTMLVNIKLKKLISNVILPGLAVFLMASAPLYSQWCVPLVTQTFSQGVREFKLNGTPAIDRLSGLNENYIVTNVSTTVTRGTNYSGTITQGFGVFCSAGNIRIWIDFNGDNDFDDEGETVFSLNNQSTQNEIPFSFTVPADAFLGTTRMRITSKMQVSCGHILPSPCNNPPDPIGYHGEIEDYDLIITNATGIRNITVAIPGNFDLKQNFPNPFNPVTNIIFDIAQKSTVNITIFDITGRTIEVLVDDYLSEGSYRVDWNAVNYPSGIYYYSMSAGGYHEVKKMVLVK